jgi:glycosyltransferase involved in cell wall biosynthesis
MNPSTQKKIVIWQPYFRGGGAEAVALWILEALSNEFDVTLCTLLPVDFSYLNSMYGTQLKSGQVKVEHFLPGWCGQAVYALMNIHDAIRMACIYATIKKLKKDAFQYDLLFSAFNAVDMGKQGIQYVHWINVVENRSQTKKYWLDGLMKWVNFSYENLESNLTLANSKCTANFIKQCYGVDSQVIYPPVVTEIKACPWIEKEEAFLCSGRLVSAKQSHKVIKILEEVRKKGFDVKLYITGGGGGKYEAEYLSKLLELSRKNADWIYIHQDLPYSDYLRILARCRYGIHYKSEPFGISIAEMLKAGMIPFVRTHGGQVEIVGDENVELLFKDEDEAVEKIVDVLNNVALQERLRKDLRLRQDLFSTEQFTRNIQAAVSDHLRDKVSLNAINLQ